MNYEKFMKDIYPTGYFSLGTVEAIEYYGSGDEYEPFIVAVDHVRKIAVRTTFMEMDDFYVDSDYSYIYNEAENTLMCRFEFMDFKKVAHGVWRWVVK